MSAKIKNHANVKMSKSCFSPIEARTELCVATNVMSKRKNAAPNELSNVFARNVAEENDSIT